MLLHEIRYTPVLKGQMNDIKALGKVPAAYRDTQLPIIEMPRPDDVKQLEKAVINFGLRIKKFAGSQIFAADLMPISPQAEVDGMPALRAAFSILRNLNLKFMPVHGVDRETDLWDEVVRCVGKTGAPVLFRLDLDDLDYRESTVGEILLCRAKQKLLRIA